MTTENNDGWIDGKFIVRRADGRDAPGCKHHGCQYFVLDLDHDSSALPTLRAYMHACKDERPALSHDLAVVIEMLETQWGDSAVGLPPPSKEKLEVWKRDYEFGLEPDETDRCFDCKHHRAMDWENDDGGQSGECLLLKIYIYDIRTTRCPGQQAVG